jgi:hypothetical protein
MGTGGQVCSEYLFPLIIIIKIIIIIIIIPSRAGIKGQIVTKLTNCAHCHPNITEEEKRRQQSIRNNSCNKTSSAPTRMTNHPSSHSVQLECLVNGGSSSSANKGLRTLWRGMISCCELHPSLSTDDFHISRKPVLTLCQLMLFPSEIQWSEILCILYKAN